MFGLSFTTAVLAIVIFFVIKHLWDVVKQRFGNAPPEWTSWIPVFGTLIPFGKNPINFLLEGRRKFGDVFTATILGKRMTFITHPHLHHIFFSRKDDELSPREVYRFVIPVFGRGIVYDAEPNVMMQQLKFVSTALVAERFKAFVPIFEQEAVRYYESKFGDKVGQYDLFDCMAELTILTASRCLLGREVRDNLAENHFAELYHTLEEGLNPLTFFLPWIPSPTANRRDAARREICDVFKAVIKNRRAKEEEHIDLLDVLMKAKYKNHDHEYLHDDEICGLLLATLFAGQHTSSITSTWTTCNLLTHPEAFNELERQQREVMARFNGELSYDSVSSMDFFKLCMQEALRLHPPLIMLMRYTKVDIPINNYVVPKGSTLVVSPATSHRAPDVFENPTKYDPWRWLPPREEEKKCEYPFIAFGRGVHRCIGETFAYLQIRTILSVLLANYDIKLVTPYPAINYDSLVAGPRKPVTVEVRKRAQKRW